MTIREEIVTTSLILTNFTPGTPIALTTDITISIDKLSLQPDEGNAGNLFIGGPVSATYPMIAGGETGLDQFLSVLKDRDIQISPTAIFIDAVNALDILHILFWDIRRA